MDRIRSNYDILERKVMDFENSTANFSNLNSSTEPNVLDGTQILHEDLALTFTILEVIIFVPTIFGNSLILISIMRFKRLRTRMNILIANLAVSDLMMGLIMIPYDVCFLYFGSLRAGKYTCLLRNAISCVCLGSSVFNLFVISMERYFAIIKPLQHVKKSTTRLLVTMIASSWALATLIAFLPFLGMNTWERGIPCDPAYIFPKIYNGILFLVLIGSITANFVMYIKVVKTAISQIESIQAEIKTTNGLNCEEKNQSIRTKMKQNKKTKMMILVLGTFAFCWGPYCIVIVFAVLFLEPSDTLDVILKVLLRFGIINSALNWIIFGVKNKTYRRAFKYLLCCGRKMNDSKLMISSSAK